MKRFLYLLLALTLFVSAEATNPQKQKPTPEQAKNAMRDKVRQEKRAFLIKELSLSTTEIDGLMPILNELDDKRFALWMGSKNLANRFHRQDKTLTAEELNSFFEQTLDFHVKEAELERTYYLRCRSVLSGEKLVRLPFVCKDFARRFFARHKR